MKTLGIIKNETTPKVTTEDVMFTMSSSDSHRGGEESMENNTETIVRRLTPLECERLQGYPDNWTLIGEPREKWVKNKVTVIDDAEPIDGHPDFIKGLEHHEEERPGYHKEIAYFYIDENGKEKECTDSARYKALGNSIALPQWYWIEQKMAAYLPKGATLGSLFDGIGGFPLTWEEIHGQGTARWASEIEPFPIAVTKIRFLEGD